MPGTNRGGSARCQFIAEFWKPGAGIHIGDDRPLHAPVIHEPPTPSPTPPTSLQYCNTAMLRLGLAECMVPLGIRSLLLQDGKPQETASLHMQSSPCKELGLAPVGVAHSGDWTNEPKALSWKPSMRLQEKPGREIIGNVGKDPRHADVQPRCKPATSQRETSLLRYCQKRAQKLRIQQPCCWSC